MGNSVAISAKLVMFKEKKEKEKESNFISTKEKGLNKCNLLRIMNSTEGENRGPEEV